MPGVDVILLEIDLFLSIAILTEVFFLFLFLVKRYTERPQEK